MKKKTGKPMAVEPGPKQIDRSNIVGNPFNPRRSADDEKQVELQKSIKEKGLLNDVTVRKLKSGKFEIVAGHRRFLAFTTVFPDRLVPCKVVELTDEQAREVSIIENIQREDLSPIDEAKSYADLMKGTPNTIEDVASKCGKRSSYIHMRLLLLGLGKEGIKALEDGKLPLTAANLLARIPEAQDRETAVKTILKEIARGANVTAVDVKEFIAENFECKLSSAPWPKDKVLEGTEIVACAGCANNTSNQEGLPGIPQDDKKEFRCTLSSCFKKKVAAWSKLIQDQAKKNGAKIATGKEATQILHTHEYVKLDDEWYRDNRTWRKLLKGKDYEVTVAIRPEDGRSFEMVRRDVAEKLAAGTDRTNPSSTSNAERQERKRLKAKREQSVAGMGVVATKMEEMAGKISDRTAIALIGFLSKRAFDHIGSNMARIIAKRRGLVAKKTDFGWNYSGALDNWYKNATTAQQWGLMMEALSAEGVEFNSDEELKKTLSFFKVKLSDVKVEEKPKAAAKEKKPKKAKK
jgi:ParB family transcriptional regulator, chromosome partitioning protein